MSSKSLTNITKIKGDRRPTDYEYALLSQHVYGAGVTKPVQDSEFETDFRTWKIIIDRQTSSGYFGAVYRCDDTKQFVIAHRGTNSFLDVLEDFRGIFLNKCSAQKLDAFLLVELIVNQIRVQLPDYKLSFTGHSLGAFLAELSVVYSVTILDFPDVNAVTFESPGSKQSIESVLCHHSKDKSQTLPQLPTCDEIKRLDVISYVCYPNLINSLNQHIGTVYAINVDDAGSIITSWSRIRLVNSHGIDGIVNWFRMAMIENDQSCKRLLMSDWPRGYHQLKNFCKYAMVENGMVTIDRDLTQQNVPPPVSRNFRKSLEAEDILKSKRTSSFKKFERWISLQRKIILLRIHGNFKILDAIDSFNVIPLKHFSEPFQDFLEQFHKELHLSIQNRRRESQDVAEMLLKEYWKTFEIPEVLIESLLSYEIRVNKDGDKEVSCDKVNIHDFRQELSCWLESKGISVQELVNPSWFEQTVKLKFRNRYEKPPFLKPHKGF